MAYPDESTRRFDQQFAETPAERNERRREMVSKRTIATLQALVADLSESLTEEGPDWSEDGLHNLRCRVANAVPPDKLPDWLNKYRDPAIIRS